MSERNSGDQRHRQALGALTIVLAVASAIAGSYAVHGSLPHNALALPGEKALKVAVVMPESWRFFTRDPREAQPFVQRRGADGRWESAMRLPNGLAVNAFGLDRTGRAQNIELSRLLGNVPKSAWTRCEGRPEACFEKLQPIPMKNDTQLRTLCGRLVVGTQQPVPFAWSKATPPVEMPSRLVALEVQC
jgi:antimicrobial peptide system SdpA family protein